MVKVIGIIKNDPITGVEYGLVEVNEPVTEINKASAAYKQATKSIQKHKTHSRQKTK
jgi:hypothetical protein